MRRTMCLLTIAVLVLSLGLSICGYSQNQSTTNKEEIVLTTYYPVPYGDYREMRSERMAVGQNWRSHATACWEAGKCNETIDESADLIVEGNVGIGNTYKPQIPAPKGDQGNLDVNDVFVRSLGSTGEWISQSGAEFTQTDVSLLGDAEELNDIMSSWPFYDLPGAQINLDAGEYLVIFRASTFHGAWCAGGIIRSDLNNIRFAWSNGLTRFQALAGASGQGHPLIVLIDVITIDQPDTVRVQVSGLCVGDPYSQAYHGSFIVAKLK